MKSASKQVKIQAYPDLPPTDKVVQMGGESMVPSFAPGCRIAVWLLANPRLLHWGEHYYLVDKNGIGIVRRVYESNVANCLMLIADNPNQQRYPPIHLHWNHIEAIYKVQSEIIMH